jgi:hypothetical protein
VIEMRKVFGFVTLSIGLLLVAAAALVSWVVAPRMAMLPGDTDVVRVYAGTASVLVNPTSLTGTTFGPGLLRDVPITLRHHTRVLQTDGDTALVSDQRAVDIPGFNIADFTYRFAVDRESMLPAAGFGAAPHTGLTFNWPMNAQRHDYQGWVVDTQSPTTLQYVGEGTRGGVDTYIYRTTVTDTVIRDPQLLTMLPPTMTKQQILALTPSLQLSERRLMAMSKVLDRLPNPVPMRYTYRLEATYWIAPDTGIVVDTTHHEVRTANFVDGSRLIPATPIMDMTYQATPATLAAAATDARDGAAALRLIRTTVPLVALFVGVLLSVVGTGLIASTTRRPAVPPSTEDADLYHLIEKS